MRAFPPIFPPTPFLDGSETRVLQGFGSLGAFPLDRPYAQEGVDTRPRVSTHILPSSHYIKKSLGEAEIRESLRRDESGCWEDYQ